MREETARGSDRTRAAAGETIDLVRRYVVQETIVPLRSIGKRLLFGAAGGILLGTGLILLLLAVLRVLQGDTGTFFAGNMSFGPYLATATVGLGVIAFAALVMLRAVNSGGRRGSGGRRRR